MPDPDRDIHLDKTDARAGSNEGVVRWVLIISLSLAIIALTIIWVTGALSQDPVESEGTATGRIEAAEDERSGLAGEMNVVEPDVPQPAQTSSPPAANAPPAAD